MKKRTHSKIFAIPFFCLILALCISFAAPAAGDEVGDVIPTDTIPLTSAAYVFEQENVPAAPIPTVPKETDAPPCRYRDDIVSDGNLLQYDLQEIMQDYGEEYDVPYALLLAIADTESKFDPDVISTTNDYGLMQINKCNHAWLLEIGIDPLTYAGNIEAGAYIISQHLKNYGETELALMAYNCGAGGAKKLWDAGTYQTDYSQKVMAAFEHWTTILEG